MRIRWVSRRPPPTKRPTSIRGTLPPMEVTAPMAGRSLRVVIVGGGAAGTLVVTNLLRAGHGGLEVVVVEPREELGLGVAYSTRDPWHRLNVPAGAMSAVADDPDHFRRWADLPAEAFARRVDYGRYVGEVLAEARASSAATLRHVVGEAERMELAEHGLRVALSDGETFRADAVVLATGVETPVQPPYLAALAHDDRVIGDPWVAGAWSHRRRGDGRDHRHQPHRRRPRGLHPQPAPARSHRRAVAQRPPAAAARGSVAAPLPRSPVHGRRVPGLR